MILSDKSIKEEIAAGTIRIEPFRPDCVQPSSVDVHLDKTFLVFNHMEHTYIDIKKPMPKLTTQVEVTDDRPFIMHPGEFVLGSTFEKLTLPNNIAARIEGKSSLGRIGLLIHSTAGYIDPGFSGNITLELSNVSRLPITLYPGMKIAQFSFQQMTTPVDKPYGSPELKSRYQGQTTPEPSKLYQDFQ